jgi:hypothetical protein
MRKHTMPPRVRAATIAIVKTLAADLSESHGNYTQTLAALRQHVGKLLLERRLLQGFGVRNRAGCMGVRK